MKEFLKENIAIVAAIVLPVILVILFALSTAITHVSVADPKYSFFVATNYYSNDNSSFAFNVIDERLVVSYKPPTKDSYNNYINNNVPRLWRVNVPSGGIEEIPLVAPGNKKPTDIAVRWALRL